MTLANSADRSGAVARALHWATAGMIVAGFALGLVADALSMATEAGIARKAAAFSLHKTAGIAALATGVLRILWALTQVRPAPLHPGRTQETRAAEGVHAVLYVALPAVPLTGWVHHAATDGFAPILWPLGQGLPLVPKSEAVALSPGALHLPFVWVLAGAVGLHLAGALKPALVDRDATLARMLRGATVPVALPFDLVTGDRPARMSGEVTLDRRAFGMGSDDEASLGFGVVVRVELTAQRVEQGAPRGAPPRRYSAIAPTEIRIATSSPMKGAKAPSPNSDRRTGAVAEKPARGLPSIGWVPALFSRASSTTAFVTPFSVRSPVISAIASPVTSIPVETRRTVTSSAASRKSGDMQCRNRASQPVSMLRTGNATSTEDADGFSASKAMCPSDPENMPQDVDWPKLSQERTIWLWLGSST